MLNNHIFLYFYLHRFNIFKHEQNERMKVFRSITLALLNCCRRNCSRLEIFDVQRERFGIRFSWSSIGLQIAILCYIDISITQLNSSFDLENLARCNVSIFLLSSTFGIPDVNKSCIRLNENMTNLFDWMLKICSSGGERGRKTIVNCKCAFQVASGSYKWHIRIVQILFETY